MQRLLPKRLQNLYRYLTRNRWVMIASFGVIGFLLPMIYAFIFGFPVPHVHDELSYLLAADTFAHGRLTNSTPQFWEHFESPHILLTPSYMSKYPPMQGLFLAAGQFIFGQPIFGVWLSCGVFASALFWMLTAWTRFRWAIIGTLMMILLIGINSYWAQSYWGGMAAASGGALFFGGFRRLFKKLSFKTTLLMVLGGVVLINSRPFEGFITILPALAVLFVWILRDQKNSASEKLLQVVLPGVLLASIALSGMFYYNFRVTGSLFDLPYSEHTKQYYPNPLFIFQSRDETAIKGHPRLRDFYESYNAPDASYLNALYALLELIFLIPFFLFSPPLMIFLYAATPLLIMRSKWLMFIIATILFTFVWMSLAIWFENYHYSASLTCCFFLLIVEGFRQFTIWGKKVEKGFNKSMASFLFIIIVFASFIYSQVLPPEFYTPPTEDSIAKSEITLDKTIKLAIPERVTFLKPVIEKYVEQLPNKYIAIVSYDKTYSTLFEIVYNEADIENSKLIWAYDLGAEKNKALLNYYSDRKILMIKVSGSQMEINPLP